MELSQSLRIEPGAVVAFTGGGGKTTAMFRLAGEQAVRQRRVLITTSTRIFAAQIKLAPAYLTFEPETQTLAELLNRLSRPPTNPILLIGRADRTTGKAHGIGPEVVEAIAERGSFDVILNEADGSRMRSFKAPARHEPVIPGKTNLVVPVVGLDVLGQPLDDDHVHRAALVSALTGAQLGQPVTQEVLVSLLSHPEGGLKGAPPKARVIPLLNKLDARPESGRQALLDQARAIAEGLLAEAKLDQVAIGAVRANDPVRETRSRVAAVVLAAGGSRRFGSPKQLARWQDTTWIERVVDTALASRARPVIVVLGAAAEACRRQLGNRPVTIVVNERWAEGQSTSLRAGLAALPPNVGAALFPLVDQPAITARVLDTLIDRHAETLAPVIWPEYDGRRGNPVLFDRALFTEMAEVTGDVGARSVLIRRRDQAVRVVVDEPGILLDFDRPQDIDNATKV